MRQNSLYYRWCVKLRFDKCWKLISYSYYEKYVTKKNNIFFRHINQNISQLISFKRDVNMIQDILSLNDENINNCIIIVLKCIIICRFNENEKSFAIWRRIIIFIKLSIKCTLRKMFKTSIRRERTSFANMKMFALYYFYCFMKVSNSRNSFDECYYRDS